MEKTYTSNEIIIEHSTESYDPGIKSTRTIETEKYIVEQFQTFKSDTWYPLRKWSKRTGKRLL